jgi:predicted HicB family RNase H-like nuclease
MIADRRERSSNLRVEVTPEMHQRLRLRAVLERTTLTALVIGALEERYGAGEPRDGSSEPLVEHSNSED